jgi:hypothetical protein
MSTPAIRKEKYIRSWTKHVEELTELGYPLATSPIDGCTPKLADAIDTLRELVQQAADSYFGTDEEIDDYESREFMG